MVEGDGPAVLLPRPVIGTSSQPTTSLPDDGNTSTPRLPSAGGAKGASVVDRDAGGVVVAVGDGRVGKCASLVWGVVVGSGGGVQASVHQSNAVNG